MATFNLPIALTFAAYLSVVLAIGVIACFKTHTASDYFLGGRKLSPGVAAFSAGASDMSGWVLLGLPGYAYVAGLEAGWIALGLCIGVALNWLLSAQRLRIYSFHLDDAVTLPTYLHRRFCCPNPWLKLFAAAFILLFFLFYVSSGLIGAGKLFVAVFGFDYRLSVLLGASIIIFYTLFGGFLAVSWTDLVQGLLMAAALVMVPVIAMQTTGGAGELFTALEAKNPELMTIWNDSKGEPLSAIAIMSLVAWGLGYFGQPHILARFKGIRSNEDVPTARRIAVSWSALSMVGAMLVGLVGILYVDTQMGGDLGDGEKIFMVLVNAIFNPVVAGILLAAILAAIMSTADSQLLVSSSALAEDFYKQIIRKDASQKEVVMVGRVAVIGLSLVAMFLAFNPDSTVLGLVSYAWAGFGAAFGPALILSLYWKRMNWQGALAGIVVGGITVVAWKQVSGGIFDLYEIVPGIVFATVAIIVVSLATAEPEQSVQDGFDRYQGKL